MVKGGIKLCKLMATVPATQPFRDTLKETLQCNNFLLQKAVPRCVIAQCFVSNIVQNFDFLDVFFFFR